MKNNESYQSLSRIALILEEVNVVDIDIKSLYEKALYYLAKYANYEAGNHIGRQLSLDDYADWGDLLRRVGRPQDALKKYEVILSLNQRASNAFLGFGYAFQQMGRLDDAIAMFNQAGKNDVRREIALASVLIQYGRIDEGLQHYTKATEIDPDSVYLLFAWADSLMVIAKEGRVLDESKVFEAIEKYKRIVALNPWLVGAYQSTGDAYKLLGKEESAEECFEQSNKIQNKIRKIIKRYPIIERING